MRIFSQTPKIPFMKYRYPFFVLSLALIVGSIYLWVSTGDNRYGVDFLGGTEVVVKFDSDTELGAVRTTVAEAGFRGAIVQAFGDKPNEFSIRLKAQGEMGAAEQILEALRGIEGKHFELLKEDVVGPVIGDEIKRQGRNALIFALLGMLIYITVRFEFRFAVGAIAALVHDVIITSGVFLFSGGEFSTAVLAALLTIVGYSLNDTIIVYDRIRENIAKALKSGGAAKKQKTGAPANLLDIMNLSINQTLNRTVLTSLTTLFVVVSLWLIGGGAVADLAYTLVIGVIVGTYSSVFVASPVVLALEGKFQKKSAK